LGSTDEGSIILIQILGIIKREWMIFGNFIGLFHLMKKALIFIIFLTFAISLYAQSPPVNFTGWYGYEWEHSFKEGKPWGFFGEGIIKRDEVIIKETQYFIRLGASYKLKSGNGLAGGFAYQYNFPYDAASKPYNWPDYRIW
jgi:hypothetical protein